jgi:hypothetical protein
MRKALLLLVVSASVFVLGCWNSQREARAMSGASPLSSSAFPWRQTDKWLGEPTSYLEVRTLTVGRDSWAVRFAFKNLSTYTLYVQKPLGDSVTVAPGLLLSPSARVPAGVRAVGTALLIGKSTPSLGTLKPGKTYVGTLRGTGAETASTLARFRSAHPAGFHARGNVGTIWGLPPAASKHFVNEKTVGVLSNDWLRVSC